MVRGGLNFSLGGVPIRIDPSFWLFAGVLGFAYVQIPVVGWWLLFAWIVVVLLSLTIHEMGHAVAFRLYGHKPSIVIYAMGGATSSSTPGGLPPGRDLVISLAGPFTGLAFGGIVYLVEQAVVDGLTGGELRTFVIRRIFQMLFFTNIVWGVLNLVPMLPLDGGRTLAAILRRFRPKDGYRMALVVSVGIGVAGMVAAVIYQQIFALFLVLMLTFSNFSQLRQLAGRGPQARLQQEMAAGVEAARRGDLERAAHVGRWATQDGQQLPVVLMASMAAVSGRPLDALEMVRQARARAPQDPGTAADLAAILVGTNRLDEAARLLDAPELPVDTLRLLHAAFQQAGRPFEAARAAARVAGT